MHTSKILQSQVYLNRSILAPDISRHKYRLISKSANRVYYVVTTKLDSHKVVHHDAINVFSKVTKN